MAGLNIISHANGNSLSEAEEIFELYMKSTPETRELLLKSCRSVFIDPQFRACVAAYKPAFRFMDLPAELRVQISEYVLSSNVVHEWRWTDRLSGKKAGTFKGLGQLTALSRVSQKLHTETSFAVWKLNKFVFKECLLGEDYGEVPSLDDSNRNQKVVPNAFDAYALFKTKTSLKTSEAIGTIILQVKANGLEKQQGRCRRIKQVAAAMPTVQFRLEILDWDFSGYELDDEDNRTITVDLNTVNTFFKNGYRLRRWLGDNGYFSPSRNWRVFPTCKGRMGTMDKYITGDRLRTARDWYDQGL